MITPYRLTERSGNTEVKWFVQSLTVLTDGVRFWTWAFSSGFKSFVLATTHCLRLVGGETKHGNNINHVWHIDSPPKRATCSSYYQELLAMGFEWPRWPFPLPPWERSREQKELIVHLSGHFPVTGKSRTMKGYDKASSTAGLMCTSTLRQIQMRWESALTCHLL